MTIQSTMFDRMSSATRKAFDKAAGITGTQTDPDLAVYNSLSHEDFASLMKDYGEANVVNYIKSMESKRALGGKTNG